MTTDTLIRLKNACAENDVNAIGNILQTADNKTLLLPTLPELISGALNDTQLDQAVVLLKEAAVANNNIAAQLRNWFTIPAIADDNRAKKQLIDTAVSVRSDCNELLELGLLYRDCQLLQSAEQLFLQLIQAKPDDIRAFHRIISVYIRMQRYHDAIACCQLALELDANSITAYYNLGVAHLAVNQHSEAFAAFAKTLEIDPQNRWAHINIAHIMLKLGYFEKGWQQYESRKLFYAKKHNDLTKVYPLWSTQSLVGKHLLVWADQGLGDNIMFAGFIDRLLQLQARVSVMAEARLQPLFERSFAITHFFPELITPEQQAGSAIDYQIPISGLAGKFIGSFSDFNPVDAYLTADQCRAEQFKASIKKRYGDKKLVGFSWRGGVPQTRDFARCIELHQCRLLFAQDNCLLINLQYDSTDSDRELVEQLGGVNLDLDHKNDIDSVAAALMAMDVLVSVDNSTAHLAAALGIPVYNLLPFSSEWRWFIDNDNSYWYKSMRLFRQSTVGQWQDVIAAVIGALPGTTGTESGP